jgi:hypothetical protein
MVLLLLMIALVALDLLALRFGSESRQGFEACRRLPAPPPPDPAGSRSAGPADRERLHGQPRPTTQYESLHAGFLDSSECGGSPL